MRFRPRQLWRELQVDLLIFGMCILLCLLCYVK